MPSTVPARRAVLGLIASFAAVPVVTTPASAKSAGEIEAGVTDTLQRFYREVPSGYELEGRAAAVLVFPTIVKAGFGVGGEYGEGALRIRGRTTQYYNSISASIGFQLGAQARSVIIMFMTPEALRGFQRKAGWKVGVDGSVTLINVGAGGAVDTNTITSPVIGFILDQKGLMYNLTLEGSKISKIRR